MTGGLLQIVTSGKQDIYLTINPEITQKLKLLIAETDVYKRDIIVSDTITTILNKIKNENTFVEEADLLGFFTFLSNGTNIDDLPFFIINQPFQTITNIFGGKNIKDFESGNNKEIINKWIQEQYPNSRVSITKKISQINPKAQSFDIQFIDPKTDAHISPPKDFLNKSPNWFKEIRTYKCKADTKYTNYKRPDGCIYCARCPWIYIGIRRTRGTHNKTSTNYYRSNN
jgi:hypothetical protein